MSREDEIRKIVDRVEALKETLHDAVNELDDLASTVFYLDDKPKTEPVADVFIVTTKGEVVAVKATNEEAEDAMGDLLSETGFDLAEGDMDILQLPVGYVETPDEGPDQLF